MLDEVDIYLQSAVGNKICKCLLTFENLLKNNLFYLLSQDLVDAHNEQKVNRKGNKEQKEEKTKTERT